jgi:hypothetical protein
MTNPPGFDHQIDFASGQDYQIVTADPTGHGWTAVTTMLPPWRFSSDGTFTVNLGIDRSQSWVLAAQVGNALVRDHEQGRYDISALVIRDFLNQATSFFTEHGNLQLLSDLLDNRLNALSAGTNCAYELITGLGTFVNNQSLWTSELRNLKANNGTSEDLRNWVNNTPFVNPASGQRITFPVP